MQQSDVVGTDELAKIKKKLEGIQSSQAVFWTKLANATNTNGTAFQKAVTNGTMHGLLLANLRQVKGKLRVEVPKRVTCG